MLFDEFFEKLVILLVLKNEDFVKKFDCCVFMRRFVEDGGEKLFGLFFFEV